jgi:hypothetical protein
MFPPTPRLHPLSPPIHPHMSEPSFMHSNTDQSLQPGSLPTAVPQSISSRHPRSFVTSSQQISPWNYIAMRVQSRLPNKATSGTILPLLRRPPRLHASRYQIFSRRPRPSHTRRSTFIPRFRCIHRRHLAYSEERRQRRKPLVRSQPYHPRDRRDHRLDLHR